MIIDAAVHPLMPTAEYEVRVPSPWKDGDWARLAATDLRDVLLWRETCTALDELTRILRLGSIYDFQR